MKGFSVSENCAVCRSDRVNASVLVVFKLHRHCEVSGDELNCDQNSKMCDCNIITAVQNPVKLNNVSSEYI